ncbi:hypothetical protein Scep_003239 [Stephania cephalantha]|uniref:Triosephosphate isomerase n=1 Tax=Stephania cephalantha TaxID=152367 RepID=A0AAP0KR28_9MAGN
MARKFLVVGNWKSNGNVLEAMEIVNFLNQAQVPSQDVVEVVVGPKYECLLPVKTSLRPDFHVAAQKGGLESGGAFNGELSVKTLGCLGIQWVILKHAEVRQLVDKTNESAGDRFVHALSVGLKVVVCVGETLEQREAGSTMEDVTAQAIAIADKVSNWDNVVLAYEPLWATGTGKVPTPAQVQEVVHELRKWIEINISTEVAYKTRIIYGGSVNGANCKEFATLPDIDGLLVGAASLTPEFVDIITSATTVRSD